MYNDSCIKRSKRLKLDERTPKNERRKIKKGKSKEVSVCVRKRKKEKEREREIERDFYFLKVHLGDSNRQPQPSRENLECYP